MLSSQTSSADISEREVSDKELEALQLEFDEVRKRLLEAKRSRKPETVQDYVFEGPGGVEIKLSDLFGKKDELILVHNMGKRCSYCTLWADGFNGFVPHLEDRAAFVVTSPDDPETQAKFARDRGWTFRMYSTQKSSFTADMGYLVDGGYWPGVSFFKKNKDGSIMRTAKDLFGPGDLYCSVFHLFDLLPEGNGEWEPKYHYI